MKFLIVGPKTENTKDLILEIKKRGALVDVVSPKEFVFFVEQGEFSVKVRKKNLLEYDIYLLRGYNKTLTETRIFAELLLSKGKVVIDGTVAFDYIPSKLYEASKILRAGLNYPKTVLVTDNKRVEEVVNELEFPVIVKPIYGQQGQGINKFNNKIDLINFLAQKDNSEKFLIQKFLEIDGDIRVFVVGRRMVLGAMKRFVVPGDFRSNASLGARAESFPVDEEIEDIALRSCEAMNYEVAGVDLARFDKKWYVIEVNSTPQWQKFKGITNINPAQEIVSYAIKKYEKNKR
ncbi:MAG TPA: RimK family alpha-L-glutamate ligase [Candidatus Moranbacteria bacterium]|nr:RimK family alpha-L-glutamate ligase [Candidatus Moranbacteria bacterium]